MMNPRIIMVTHSGSLVRLSNKDRDALFYQAYPRRLARCGCVVDCSPQVALLVLALAARPGSMISKDDLVEILFSDREDGGPDGIQSVFLTLWDRAKVVLVALGYKPISAYNSRGCEAVIFAERAA